MNEIKKETEKIIKNTGLFIFRLTMATISLFVGLWAMGFLITLLSDNIK